jgi:hypothetical protein
VNCIAGTAHATESANRSADMVQRPGHKGGDSVSSPAIENISLYRNSDLR